MSTNKSSTKTKSSKSSKAGETRQKLIDVLSILRERIAHYDLPPGTKLNESDLAQEFNVPRTRIRDVFTALEQRGLIERIPNRGAMVARLEPEQIFEIYDMREVLEGLCARLACQNADPSYWQELLDQFSGPVEQAVANGDFDSYMEIYGLFRRRCIEKADNYFLAQALDSIYEKTEVLIRRIIILPGRGEIGVREHRQVLEAMRRGDAYEAEKLRRGNIKNAKAFLAKYLKYIL